MKSKSVWMVAAACAAAVGCQETEEPTTVLTQQQWREVEANILKEAPKPQHAIGADFGGKVELIGFDVSSPIKAGEDVTFTWYWRAKQDMKKNWKVFVHLDSKAKPIRQNLDHHPVNGLYQTARWKKGQIIKDVHTVRMRADYPAGEAVPHVGFYHGKERLPIANDVKKTNDRRAIGPALKVEGAAPGKKRAARKRDKPRYAVRILEGDDASVTLDGKLEEPVWKSLQPAHLVPFGRGQTRQTWVKVFATKEALYVGAYLQDDHIWGELEERDANTWTQEVLEMFVDTNGDGEDYLELQVTPRNTIFDANFKKQLGRGQGTRDEQIDRARSWNMEGLETAVALDGTLNDDSDRDRAWTIEIKLPFASMPGLSGAPPKPGDRWAVNFYRFDRPKPRQSFAYAWNTEPRGNFHQVSKFGELRFVPNMPASAKALELDPKLKEKLEVEGAPTSAKPAPASKKEATP